MDTEKSLRDEFAMAALMTLLSDEPDMTYVAAAEHAYKYADATMGAREDDPR